MKRMYQKQLLGMPRECLNEKIVYLKKTITENTTVKLDDLVPNWKDYDRIIINCDECSIPSATVLFINVSNDFNGCLIVKGIANTNLVGQVGISQGKNDDAPVLHGIYCVSDMFNAITEDQFSSNDLTNQNYCAGKSADAGGLTGTMLRVYNKIAIFNVLSYNAF